jgi:hypothetical protein
MQNLLDTVKATNISLIQEDINRMSADGMRVFSESKGLLNGA